MDPTIGDVTGWGGVEGAIEAARAGRVESLGLALESFRQYLRVIARGGLGPGLLAKADASDLVQDTFLAAQRDFDRFQGRSRDELRAWLREILRHILANLRRHHGREKRQVAREVSLAVAGLPGDPWRSVPDDAPTPGTHALLREREAALVNALNRLTEHDRRIVTLHHQEGCTFDEIGRRMDCSAEAARKKWSRALIILGREVSSSHDDP